MIVFFSNFLNHHQYPVAEELYRLTCGRYCFIETVPMPNSFKKSGYTLFDTSWVIRSWENDNNKELAQKLILEADVLIYGGELTYNLLKRRLNKGLLTFEVGERWLKRGILNFLSPRLIKSQFYYHLFFYNKPFYRLNASAFAANDLAWMHSFKNRMFKWGYFTEIISEGLKKPLEAPCSASKLRILYVSRFLGWKHPELPVKMAKKLKNLCYDFELNMYGDGPEHERIQKMIQAKSLKNEIKLLGNLPNKEILQEMRNHDVFLFTSDRNEGWGAVLNEAMSCGCAVVASDEIGSVPFLIQDGVNGLIFKSHSVESLTQKVILLAENRGLSEQFGSNARKTVNDVWSPRNAALNLLKLIDGIENGNSNIIAKGPCSPAYPIRKNR